MPKKPEAPKPPALKFECPKCKKYALVKTAAGMKCDQCGYAMKKDGRGDRP